MKIVRLEAENVKRLKAVEITPDPTVQVIGGRNAQGKSSVLDAIWLALGGGKASKATSRPVRDGAEKATVTLDLGDLKVTRTWTKGGASTSLRVEAADGARYPSPQSILDRLVAQLSFDPLAFTRLPAREQRAALLDLVDLGVDLDALDAERDSLYQERADVGRAGKAIGEVTVDDSLPDEETPMTVLLAEARRVREHNSSVASAAARVREAEHERATAAAVVRDLEERLEQARVDAVDASNRLYAAQESAQALGEQIDPSDVEQRIATLEETNAAVRANNAAREKAYRKKALRREYEVLTEQINAIDKRKSDALAAAEFPVPGLGFDSQGVTYQDVPFSQASSAEQIRVSVAMAMATNPNLRVLRIMDGSLLDADSMAALHEQCAAQDFQLWIERVGDADKGAVIIEDGQISY